MAPSCERPTAAAEARLRLIYGENERILPDIAKTMARIQLCKPWPVAVLTGHAGAFAKTCQICESS
jgi:hypothetical protein